VLDILKNENEDDSL